MERVPGSPMALVGHTPRPQVLVHEPKLITQLTCRNAALPWVNWLCPHRLKETTQTLPLGLPPWATWKLGSERPRPQEHALQLQHLEAVSVGGRKGLGR